MQEPKRIPKVLIVNAGGNFSLSADRGSYDNLVESQAAVLQQPRKDGNVTAEVQILRSADEVEANMKDTGAVIFVTGGMIAYAKQLQLRYPHVMIIILSGDVPRREVHLFTKAEFTNDLLVKIVGG